MIIHIQPKETIVDDKKPTTSQMEPSEVHSIDEIIDIQLRDMVCLSHLRDSDRRISNYIDARFIALDFDNGFPFESVREILKPYSHWVLGSLSDTPEYRRYHTFIACNQLKTPAAYGAGMTKLKALGLPMDLNAQDCVRVMARHTSVIYRNPGVLFNVPPTPTIPRLYVEHKPKDETKTLEDVIYNCKKWKSGEWDLRTPDSFRWVSFLSVWGVAQAAGYSGEDMLSFLRKNAVFERGGSHQFTFDKCKAFINRRK